MLLQDVTKFVNFPRALKKGQELWELCHQSVYSGAIIIVASYILASIVSAIAMSNLLERSLKAPALAARDLGGDENISGKRPNYRNIQKTVLKRNLFNSEGKLPDESSPEEEQKKSIIFDARGPCKKPTLNVELVGTIFLGDATQSLAAIKEKGFEDPDIYHVGETIIGQDQARVYSIERQRVVLNNNGVKECLELGEAAEQTAQAQKGGEEGAKDGDGKAGGDEGSCTLESSYVEKELGPGFGKIVQAARLVPNTVDNAINGFKIFSIDPNSLFGKVGLKNGDVITQVNDTSLKQPEQGFALYQAFQDEREVRIHILRGEKTPKMIHCQIK